MFSRASSRWEAASVKLGNLLDGLALGQGGKNHLVAAGLDQLLAHVAHVGDVLDVVDLQAVVRECPADSSRPSCRSAGCRCGRRGKPLARRCTCSPCPALRARSLLPSLPGCYRYAGMPTSHARRTASGDPHRRTSVVYHGADSAASFVALRVTHQFGKGHLAKEEGQPQGLPLHYGGVMVVGSPL